MAPGKATDSSKKEHIVLDGQIRGVLGEAAFDVELPNGHGLVGFVVGRDRPAAGSLGAGDRVRLDMSPCDMSKGRILVEREEGGER